MVKFDSSLYFITDSTIFDEEEFLYRAEEALKGGVTLLQLREKTDEMDGRAMADSEEEIALIRKNARLNRKIAEKIIIRGLDTKCR